jgi:adenosylcobinamide-GDP ribazoletransferase
VSGRSFFVGLGFALAIGFLIAAPAVGVLGVLLALLLALLAVLGWTAACRRLAGGQTGDLIGAQQALIEVALFTGFLLLA